MLAVRLKTKLVLAITLMVMVIVAALSVVYVSEVVQKRFESVNDTAKFIAHEVSYAARTAFDRDLSNSRVDINNPAQFAEAAQEILQTDAGVNNLMESIAGYELNIQDAAVVDTEGRAVLHTSSSLVSKNIKSREDFGPVVNGGLRKQLGIVYGPIQVYDVRIPLERSDTHQPFGEVRVGVSTVLLRNDLRPLLRTGPLFLGSSLLISMVLAAVLSNAALRPLRRISERLDLINSGAVEITDSTGGRADEYGAVTSKIDRLGRQVRDVKEVFSAMKENLEQMMANLEDGVMLFTSDFKTVLVSASAEQFVGKPRGEMLGRQPQEIFSGDSALGHALLEAFRTRKPIDQEEIEVENGRHIQISLDFIEERDERIGALLTLRDSESVHRIEGEIELSRRLAAIGRLTSGVAHEVKNPINAIVVHLEVLRQKLSAADPDARRHMDVIGSEIRRLDRVVQTLVDFTRPVDLRLADMDLRRLVDEVVNLASPEAGRHQVRIDRDDNAQPLISRIDADLVKQAILNIVINGVQAMPKGGTLHVITRREGEMAVVQVRDEGTGIPAEIRDKIYNLYFTTKADGSGIGLAMAYRVVQLHNGSLEFDSLEGQGATFYLRFPMSEDSATGEHAGAPSEDSLKTV